MPSEKKNHRKSMHRKHIVLMIMTTWSAKITFAQNEDPPKHTLPSFQRGQFSVIKCSFDVELRWIRKFALRDKSQYCVMHCCYIANFLLRKDTNFSPLWTKDSTCVLIFEIFPSKDVFQGVCSVCCCTERTLKSNRGWVGPAPGVHLREGSNLKDSQIEWLRHSKD